MKHVPPLPILAVFALLVWAAFSYPLILTSDGETVVVFPTLILAALAWITYARIRATQNRNR